MKLSKQDRNTALTIIIVLVVCTISLIAIGSFLWRLVAPGVENVGQVLGMRASSYNTNYNFEVRGFEFAEQKLANEQAADENLNTDSGYNYNFSLPKRR